MRKHALCLATFGSTLAIVVLTVSSPMQAQHIIAEPSRKPPVGVLRWVASLDSGRRAIELIQNIEKAKDARETVRQAASATQAAVSIGRAVSRAELNALYPQWGDHFHDEWVPGMGLMADALPPRRTRRLSEAAPMLQRWNAWYYANFESLMGALKRRGIVGVGVDPR